MSYHCHSGWTWTDPIEDCPIESIAAGVQCHGYTTFPVYGLFCTADALIHSIGKLIPKHRKVVKINDDDTETIEREGTPITREIIEAFTPVEFEFREKAIEVIVRVIEKLGEIPAIRYRQPKPFTKISIPKVNKPFPKLSLILGNDPMIEGLKEILQPMMERKDDGRDSEAGERPSGEAGASQ